MSRSFLTAIELYICLLVWHLSAFSDISGINTVAVDEDGPAILHCLLTTSPSASVRWLKDGQPLYQSEDLMIYKNASLVIKKAKLSDSGIYECLSDELNSTGQPFTSKVANLTIRERLKFVSLPTVKNLELNSNSKLICKARGAPILTVKWIRWSKEGQLSLDWPQHIQDLNGTLLLNPVKSEDAGNYTCVATNPQGIINASVEVLVTVKPKFTVQPKDLSVVEGSLVALHCQAQGKPQPSIQWDRNTVLNGFDQQRFTVLTNGTLIIDQAYVEDTGKYGCTAGNSGGFIRSEMSLSVVSSEEYHRNPMSANPEESTDKMKRTVAITLTAATLYMVLVMALMVYCRYRRAKRKANAGARAVQNKPNTDLEMKERTNGTENPEQHRLLSSGDPKAKVVKLSVLSEGDVHSQTSSTHSSKRSKSPYDRLQMSRQELQKICLLGHGEFGEVFLAKSGKPVDPSGAQIVLVKALHSNDENMVIDFKREIEMFSKLNHNRIVRLIGLCKEAEPFLMVLEYSDWGDLKQFLLATRDGQSRKGPKPTPLTLPQMMGISHQIATAMEYLTNNRLVHKDLAARNCLITSKLDIKITSTSLSKDTYSAE